MSEAGERVVTAFNRFATALDRGAQLGKHRVALPIDDAFVLFDLLEAAARIVHAGDTAALRAPAAPPSTRSAA